MPPSFTATIRAVLIALSILTASGCGGQAPANVAAPAPTTNRTGSTANRSSATSAQPAAAALSSTRSRTLAAAPMAPPARPVATPTVSPLVSGATATAAANEANAVRHLGAGNTLLHAGNLPGARAEYATAQAFAPTSPPVLAAAATAQALARATAGATAKLVADHLGAAHAFEQAGNYPAALQEYEEALRLDPQSEPAQSGRRAARAAATATAAIPTATPAAPAAPTPITAALTGFLATDSDWERTHRPDPRRAPGAAYDRQADGSDMYAAVVHAGGRVIQYVVQFANPGIDASAATLLVKAELPGDAKLTADVRYAGCELLLFNSPTLGRIPFGGSPSNWVGVDLQSADLAYDPRRVTDASIGFGRPDYATNNTC